MVAMSEVQFLAMVSGYSQYYGPMMELWRVVFLTGCIVGGIVIGSVLMVQRGLSAYI